MGRAFEVRKASMMKTGMAKAKVYSRFSKEIYIIAKNGGCDVEANNNLKRVIERAKKEQVPSDIIKRALDKASSNVKEEFKENRYEGFGPNGSSIIVSCLTDNDNRTISEVKNCFTKSNNKIGVEGSVIHMYDFLGVVSVKNITEDDIMELVIENDIDVDDIESEEVITIYVNSCDIQRLVEVLLTKITEGDILTEEITWISKVDTELEGDDKESFLKLINMLNDCDDVQNIYHNVINI